MSLPGCQKLYRYLAPDTVDLKPQFCSETSAAQVAGGSPGTGKS